MKKWTKSESGGRGDEGGRGRRRGEDNVKEEEREEKGKERNRGRDGPRKECRTRGGKNRRRRKSRVDRWRCRQTGVAPSCHRLRHHVLLLMQHVWLERKQPVDATMQAVFLSSE